MVLGWWNAYDYFNHLRLKHLPKTDLPVSLEPIRPVAAKDRLP